MFFLFSCFLVPRLFFSFLTFFFYLTSFFEWNWKKKKVNNKKEAQLRSFDFPWESFSIAFNHPFFPAALNTTNAQTSRGGRKVELEWFLTGWPVGGRWSQLSMMDNSYLNKALLAADYQPRMSRLHCIMIYIGIFFNPGCTYKNKKAKNKYLLKVKVCIFLYVSK